MRATHFVKISVIFLVLMACYGCPEEHPEYDTSLYIQNTSEDTLHVRWYTRSIVDFKDSLLSNEEVESIYSYQHIPGLIIELAPLEKLEFEDFLSSEMLETSPVTRYRYVISKDTLDAYGIDSWNRTAGMKKFYFASRADYERINYTLEFP